VRLVRVTEIDNRRRHPRWINPDYVVMLAPDTPEAIGVDGTTVSVQRTRVTFENGSAFCVQGSMDEVAARLNGVEP
jgi:hypothetical protein